MLRAKLAVHIVTQLPVITLLSSLKLKEMKRRAYLCIQFCEIGFSKSPGTYITLRWTLCTTHNRATTTTSLPGCSPISSHSCSYSSPGTAPAQDSDPYPLHTVPPAHHVAYICITHSLTMLSIGDAPCSLLLSASKVIFLLEVLKVSLFPSGGLITSKSILNCSMSTEEVKPVF